MSVAQLVKVGRLLKPHGLNGEIKVVFEGYSEESIVSNGILFIREAGSYVPYGIEQVRGGGSAIMILKGVNDRTEATRLSSKDIFADATKIEIEEPDELIFEFAIGFVINDAEAGIIGQIEDVLEYPQQEMAVVKSGDIDMLIPLNDTFITSVDEEGKVLNMTLPEGLLDMYSE